MPTTEGKRKFFNEMGAGQGDGGSETIRDRLGIFEEGAMLRKALMRFRTAELTGRYSAPR